MNQDFVRNLLSQSQPAGENMPLAPNSSGTTNALNPLRPSKDRTLSRAAQSLNDVPSTQDLQQQLQPQQTVAPSGPPPPNPNEPVGPSQGPETSIPLLSGILEGFDQLVRASYYKAYLGKYRDPNTGLVYQGTSDQLARSAPVTSPIGQSWPELSLFDQSQTQGQLKDAQDIQRKYGLSFTEQMMQAQDMASSGDARRAVQADAAAGTGAAFGEALASIAGAFPDIPHWGVEIHNWLGLPRIGPTQGELKVAVTHSPTFSIPMLDGMAPGLFKDINMLKLLISPKNVNEAIRQQPGVNDSLMRRMRNEYFRAASGENDAITDFIGSIVDPMQIAIGAIPIGPISKFAAGQVGRLPVVSYVAPRALGRIHDLQSSWAFQRTPNAVANINTEAAHDVLMGTVQLRNIAEDNIHHAIAETRRFMDTPKNELKGLWLESPDTHLGHDILNKHRKLIEGHLDDYTQMAHSVRHEALWDVPEGQTWNQVKKGLAKEFGVNEGIIHSTNHASVEAITERLGQVQGQLADLAQNGNTQTIKAQRAQKAADFYTHALGLVTPERGIAKSPSSSQLMGDILGDLERAEHSEAGRLNPITSKIGKTFNFVEGLTSELGQYIRPLVLDTRFSYAINNLYSNVAMAVQRRGAIWGRYAGARRLAAEEGYVADTLLGIKPGTNASKFISEGIAPGQQGRGIPELYKKIPILGRIMQTTHTAANNFEIFSRQAVFSDEFSRIMRKEMSEVIDSADMSDDARSLLQGISGSGQLQQRLDDLSRGVVKGENFVHRANLDHSTDEHLMNAIDELKKGQNRFGLTSEEINKAYDTAAERIVKDSVARKSATARLDPHDRAGIDAVSRILGKYDSDERTQMIRAVTETIQKRQDWKDIIEELSSDQLGRRVMNIAKPVATRRAKLSDPLPNGITVSEMPMHDTSMGTTFRLTAPGGQEHDAVIYYTNGGKTLDLSILPATGPIAGNPARPTGSQFKPSELRALGEYLARRFPDAERVTGFRATAGHAPVEQWMDLAKFRTKVPIQPRPSTIARRAAKEATLRRVENPEFVRQNQIKLHLSNWVSEMETEKIELQGAAAERAAGDAQKLRERFHNNASAAYPDVNARWMAFFEEKMKIETEFQRRLDQAHRHAAETLMSTGRSGKLFANDLEKWAKNGYPNFSDNPALQAKLDSYKTKVLTGRNSVNRPVFEKIMDDLGFHSNAHPWLADPDWIYESDRMGQEQLARLSESRNLTLPQIEGATRAAEQWHPIGIGPSTPQQFEDFLGIDPGSLVDSARQRSLFARDMAVKEAKKVLFDYAGDHRNIDRILRTVMPFEFWATRYMAFQAKEAIRDPQQAYHTMRIIKTWLDETKDEPFYERLSIRIMTLPDGTKVRFNAAPMIVPLGSNIIESLRTAKQEDADAIDTAGSLLKNFMGGQTWPWITVGASMMGMNLQGGKPQTTMDAIKTALPPITFARQGLASLADAAGSPGLANAMLTQAEQDQVIRKMTDDANLEYLEKGIAGRAASSLVAGKPDPVATYYMQTALPERFGQTIFNQQIGSITGHGAAEQNTSAAYRALQLAKTEDERNGVYKTFPGLSVNVAGKRGDERELAVIHAMAPKQEGYARSYYYQKHSDEINYLTQRVMAEKGEQSTPGWQLRSATPQSFAAFRSAGGISHTPALVSYWYEGKRLPPATDEFLKRAYKEYGMGALTYQDWRDRILLDAYQQWIFATNNQFNPRR